MAVSCMILGVSGTGKSASMRNCESDKFALVNVAKKPLPFKGNFTERYEGDNYQSIKSFMKSCRAKSIVIDDAQYLMGNEFMRRVTERGYDKFSEMAQNMWELLNFINLELPADKVVYLLGHIERDQDGNEKFKTMGKLIDQCINVEGTCTIVLKTHVADGQYSFLTQNSGHDTVKSPIGMFPSYAIDNDLNYIDEKIRNYYELGEFLSDEDIAEIDEAAKKDDIPIDDGKKKRGRRSAKKEEPEETPAEEKKEEMPKRKNRKTAEENTDNDGESAAEQSTTTDDAGDVEKPKRRSRKKPAVNTDPGPIPEESLNVPEPEEEELPFSGEPTTTPTRRRRRRAE